jgi:thymidylate synthase
MNIADKYFIETLKELKNTSNVDVNPRAKYKDGTPANTKFITQKTFTYDISKGEFPINTLRNTAIKGGWYDIEAIYIKQTNIIEEMHPSIHSWWKDFVVISLIVQGKICKDCEDLSHLTRRVIGQTYGHTVRRYDLMSNLLNGLEFNPFSRRHIINLWQEQQMIDDPKALVPCAYETLWSVREEFMEFSTAYNNDNSENNRIYYRYIDLTLNQRSMDYLMVSSINPTQYVMFGMAVCGHLTQATGIKHTLGIFTHHVQNLHVYDRHLWAIDELLNRETREQPKIELLVNKNFYDYTIEDFKITLPEGIEKLSKQLELAI